jgi:hypothetical protein
VSVGEEWECHGVIIGSLLLNKLMVLMHSRWFDIWRRHGYGDAQPPG